MKRSLIHVIVFFTVFLTVINLYTQVNEKFGLTDFLDLIFLEMLLIKVK